MNRSSHPLVRLLSRRRVSILGINSGTSIDGLDGCLLEVTADNAQPNYRVRGKFSRAFPSQLQRRLFELASSERIGKRDVAQMHSELGEFIGECARQWKKTLSQRGFHVHLIASHGQTIAHYPHRAGTYTSQIGSINHIAQKTGLVCIGDFRVSDTAAGGMGAPLSGYYHHLLFGEGIPVLNIGGIANVSVSCRVRGRLRVTAFDTGPGNMILDLIAQRRLHRPYDLNGGEAARGKPIEAIVSRLQDNPYLRQTPPKTCGREEFGETVVRGYLKSRMYRTPDLLASAIEVTARSIATAIQKWIEPETKNRNLILTGGGVQNRTLIRRLQFHLPNWILTTSDAFGLPSRYVEPAGFAALAYETLHARAGNLGGATGAAKSAVLGIIALPPPDA